MKQLWNSQFLTRSKQLDEVLRLFAHIHVHEITNALSWRDVSIYIEVTFWNFNLSWTCVWSLLCISMYSVFNCYPSFGLSSVTLLESLSCVISCFILTFTSCFTCVSIQEPDPPETFPAGIGCILWADTSSASTLGFFAEFSSAPLLDYAKSVADLQSEVQPDTVPNP